MQIGKIKFQAFLFLGALLVESSNVNAQEASAMLLGADNQSRGSVTLQQTNTGVLLKATVVGLNSGVHAFHIHEFGKCEPDAKAAGGHFAPEKNTHGYLSKGGPHAGDMPNFEIPADVAEFQFEVFNSRISLDAKDEGSLLDHDGASIVIHEGGDDYSSQPAGSAGKRVACGVIKAN